MVCEKFIKTILFRINMNYLITRWFGTFLYDEKKLQDKILFPKNKEIIAERLKKISEGVVLSEEKKIAKGKKVIVNEKRLSKLGVYKPDDAFFKKVKINPSDFGFNSELLKKASILVTKEKIAEKLEKDDLQVVQMVNCVDDLMQTYNLLSERFDRWSILPESEEKISPLRDSLSVIKKNMEELEELIREDMYKIAPNVSSVVGPMIGARLIAQAGSLRKLAMLPASAIQILGAEKALFRFKKEGGSPPKHGVIFQHPYIRKSPKKYRGRIARVISASICTAAKADVFTHKDLSDGLKKKLDSRIKEIKNL